MKIVREKANITIKKKRFRPLLSYTTEEVGSQGTIYYIPQ